MSATICVGIGCSHSSQLSLAPQRWAAQAELDRTRTPYEALLKTAAATMPDELRVDVLEERHRRSQDAVARLGQRLLQAAPDTILVVGDDQSELFTSDCLPA